MLTIGLILTLGTFNFSRPSVSSSSIDFIPLIAALAQLTILVRDLGPNNEAPLKSLSSFAVSVFAIHPAIISGFPVDESFFILLIILCSVVSFTEQVTIMFKSGS